MFTKSVAFAFYLFAAFALLTANAAVVENKKRIDGESVTWPFL